MRDLATKARLAIAAGVDTGFRKLALSRSASSRARSRSEQLGPRERAAALTAIAELYGEAAKDEASFFPAGADPSEVIASPPKGTAPTREGGVRVLDLSWQSVHEPHVAELSERHRDPVNERAVARAFLHDDAPRTAVILVHGYLSGAFAVEERAFPVRWMLSRGLDVVLAVLPFHGLRGTLARPRFPSSDPRLTIEGFRHAMRDLRTLVRWLKARGAPAVGAMGMSLGGYSTALLATVEPELAFAAPFIPLASIADFARSDDRFVGTHSQREEQHTLLERAHMSVSPLHRAPLVPPEGRLVIGARADRITPLAHSEKIAAHWDAPLVVFDGGHLIQSGRREGFRAFARMLESRGLVPPRG